MGTGVIEVDGVGIAWERHGAGEPVLLVHGLTECRSMWEPVAERLAASREVVMIDLRGHGESSDANDYDAGSMAADVVAALPALGLERPDVVGHSLGGVVATAVGSAACARSVVNVDQPLQLGEFRQQIGPLVPLLTDPASFGTVIGGMLQQMEGPLLPTAERHRLAVLRRAEQDVVLGVWRMLIDQEPSDVDVVVDELLAGYRAHPTPYLSLHGADPGDGYAGWLTARVPQAVVEVWDGHGHYPHLVDPDRFVARLHDFWS